MKYYKLLTKVGSLDNFWVLNKIYLEDAKRTTGACNVKELVQTFPSDWQEVPAGDYFVQENILPECFRVKMIKHPLREKYIEWWRNEFNTKFPYKGDLGKFYGFDSYDRTSSLNAAINENLPENAIELTLEQWDKIVNKKEINMKKEIIGYKFKENLFDTKNKSKITWLKNIASFGLIHDQMDDPDENEILKIIFEDSTVRSHFEKAGVLELWFEPVYKQEIPDIEAGDYIYIINACLDNKKYSSPYNGDVLKVTSFEKEGGSFYPDSYWLIHTPKSFSGGGFRVDKSAWEYGVHFRKATTEEILEHLKKEFTKKTSIEVGSNVQEINREGIINYGEVKKFFLHIKGKETGNYSTLTHNWFDDNPNEKYQLGIRLKNSGVMSPNCTLSKPKLMFGGYDVTFEKATSGVRITCAGETGTLSQMKKIYDFITEEGKPFKFGSQKLKYFEFNDGGKWIAKDNNSCTKLTIGCTTGTWKEFYTILEEAKKLENE